MLTRKSTSSPDEWQYYLEGNARMTVFAAEHNARTFNYTPGDVGVAPFAMGHYVQNTSSSSVSRSSDRQPEGVRIAVFGMIMEEINSTTQKG